MTWIRPLIFNVYLFNTYMQETFLQVFPFYIVN